MRGARLLQVEEAWEEVITLESFRRGAGRCGVAAGRAVRLSKVTKGRTCGRPRGRMSGGGGLTGERGFIASASSRACWLQLLDPSRVNTGVPLEGCMSGDEGAAEALADRTDELSRGMSRG